MLRIAIKFPYRGISRIQRHGAPRLYIASRYYQSKGNKEGGGGGRTFLYLVGTVSLATGATVAFANYDPEFRQWLGENVPYSDGILKSLLQEEHTYSEQIINLLESAKSRVWDLFFSKEEEKPKEVKKVVKVKQATEDIAIDVQPKKDYKVAGGQDRKAAEDPANLPQGHPRNLVDLELKIATAATIAINSYNKAAGALREHSQDIYAIVEDSVQNLDPSIWPKLKEKTDKKEKLVKEAEVAAKQAAENIERLKEILELGPIDAPIELIEQSKRTIQGVLEDVDKAFTDLEAVRKKASVTDKYWKKVEEARQHWTEEMEILFPGVNLNQRELKIASGELDLFILYAFQNVLFYQKELKKLETLGECRVKDALEAKGEYADASLIAAQVEADLDKERRQLALDFQKKCLALRMESERDVRLQMKRQAEAHADHLKDAVAAKGKEVDRHYRRQADEQIAAEEAKYKAKLASMLGRLKGMDSALKARADADKCAHQSQVLWSACQALYATLKSNSPGVPWVEQLRPLAPEICAVKNAAPREDQLVQAVVVSIPSEALERGVFTEDALRERFLKVERIARQVALVPEKGGSIPLFLLSYLQSFLLIRAISPIPQAELADEPVDFAELDTYNILQRARYWLDRGDFSMTLRYMNLLKGASRRVACDWMNEARILLETQLAATTLMAHASASGLLYL